MKRAKKIHGKIYNNLHVQSNAHITSTAYKHKYKQQLGIDNEKTRKLLGNVEKNKHF